VAVTLTVTFAGDVDMHQRLQGAVADPKPFLKEVAVFGMARAQERLLASLNPDDGGATSGHLVNSLTIGGVDAIFELSDTQTAWGSNLRYAAQVNEGGFIEPKTGKALAIPLTPQLKRSGLWPRDFEPGQLTFIHYTGDKPNIFGLLIDAGKPLEGKQRKKRGQTPFGPGPLFALAYWVNQVGKHYLEIREEDLEEIAGPMWQRHIGL